MPTVLKADTQESTTVYSDLQVYQDLWPEDL